MGLPQFLLWKEDTEGQPDWLHTRASVTWVLNEKHSARCEIRSYIAAGCGIGLIFSGTRDRGTPWRINVLLYCKFFVALRIPMRRHRRSPWILAPSRNAASQEIPLNYSTISRLLEIVLTCLCAKFHWLIFPVQLSFQPLSINVLRRLTVAKGAWQRLCGFNPHGHHHVPLAIRLSTVNFRIKATRRLVIIELNRSRSFI